MFYESPMRRKLSGHMIYEPLTILLQLPNLPYFIMSALYTPQKPHYKSKWWQKVKSYF